MNQLGLLECPDDRPCLAWSKCPACLRYPPEALEALAGHTTPSASRRDRADITDAPRPTECPPGLSAARDLSPGAIEQTLFPPGLPGALRVGATLDGSAIVAGPFGARYLHNELCAVNQQDHDAAANIILLALDLAHADCADVLEGGAGCVRLLERTAAWGAARKDVREALGYSLALSTTANVLCGCNMSGSGRLLEESQLLPCPQCGDARWRDPSNAVYEIMVRVFFDLLTDIRTKSGQRSHPLSRHPWEDQAQAMGPEKIGDVVESALGMVGEIACHIRTGGGNVGPLPPRWVSDPAATAPWGPDAYATSLVFRLRASRLCHALEAFWNTRYPTSRFNTRARLFIRGVIQRRVTPNHPAAGSSQNGLVPAQLRPGQARRWVPQ